MELQPFVFSLWIRIFPLQEVKDELSFPKIERMPTERCAKLMAVGMANNLDEVWISENPSLLLVYFNQYFPNLFRWYAAHSEKKMILWWYSNSHVFNLVAFLSKRLY